jgi:hypothetical protein
MDIPKSFISIIILFHEAFKYGDGVKFWGYVGINIEPLSVELLNNVREVYRFLELLVKLFTPHCNIMVLSSDSISAH